MDTPKVLFENPISLHVASMFGPVNMMPDNAHQAVRPADVGFFDSADCVVLEGEVTAKRFMGRDVLCDITLSGGEAWQAITPIELAPDLGTHKIFVPHARLMLFKS